MRSPATVRSISLWILWWGHLVATTALTTPVTTNKDWTSQPCYYRNSATEDKWCPRILLQDLRVGDALQGIVVQQHLSTKTTPKLFLDCGVCREHKKKRNWAVVNGMLRMQHAYKKESVVRKKAARLAKKRSIPVHVSRIFLAEGRFEVVLDAADVPRHPKVLQSSSRLQPGDTARGKVIRWNDYGVMVRLAGYNRPGLLHILRVRETYGKYIDGKAGLQATLPLVFPCVVLSNEKKRLFLDFHEDFKREIQQPELRAQVAEVADTSTVVDQDLSTPTKLMTDVAIDSPAGDSYEDEEDEEWYDQDGDDEEYDEDRDLEDRFGMGTY